MVLTRNSCMSENFRASKKILRDIKHQQRLRPRVSNPNYREESPDEIAYYRNILKVDVKNKKSLSHKLRIRSDNCKNSYKEIHRYELRATSNEGIKCEISHNGDCTVASVHESDHKNDKNRIDQTGVNNDERGTLPTPLLINPASEKTTKNSSIFGVNKSTFKRRLSSTFKKHSELDNSQICYDNGRRYPIRLRRRPTDVYMVNTAYNSGPKSNWRDSMKSPIQNCYDASRHRKLELYSKQSDSDDSDDLIKDEIRFENRKQRSMQRARMEFKPLNMCSTDVTDLFNERTLAKSSLADIEPMVIDKTVNFDMVGGNKGCIQALKESVVLPLVYPEVFEKLNISPPRGLLFYGAPGSGKTLMARALVNECSNGGNCKIAFFMRKGADCLSKWVGESERQLRLLFDQAYKMRPSIIFFDEIDGLAPVRSARQDQIHSSIVSTLLSLIDGLDDRGQIIVIGATNRLDNIDPALRRPGRFDREFLFTLPEENVRKDILKIHTRKWQFPLSDTLLDDLASVTKGYSGADLKGLVVEAGLCALRRRYPQIYRSQKKLQLDIKEIYVKEDDFKSALKIVRPSNERSGFPINCKIPQRLRILLESQYLLLKDKVSFLFQEPVFLKDISTLCTFSSSSSSSLSYCRLFKRHLLVTGYCVDTVISGLFHDIHNVHISSLDCLYISTNNGLSIEEKLCHLFLEAQKSPRSIIYLPQFDITFLSMSLTAQNMLLSFINGTVPNGDCNVSNILIMATLSINDSIKSSSLWTSVEFDSHQSENVWGQLGHCFVSLSSPVTIKGPLLEQRLSYFCQLTEQILLPVTMTRSDSSEDRHDSQSHEEEVLKEVELKPMTLSKMELDKLELEEDNILRKFRMLLRKILANLIKERKFQIFHNPVDKSEVPDYYNIVVNPMDLSTMRQKVDLYNYCTFEELKNDLHLISANALLYNPPKSSYLKDIRRHAYEFNDIADSILEEHLNPEFAKIVTDIHQSRLKRHYYEKKKLTLAQQPGDVLDFLTDLNGSTHQVSSGPLLKSQMDMYHNFYSKSAMKVKVGTRAHSDSETVVTGKSPLITEPSKCKSLYDITDSDKNTENIEMTLESFKNMAKSQENDRENKCKSMEDSGEPMEVCFEGLRSCVGSEEAVVRAVVIDCEELQRVCRQAALKSEGWTLFQLESLYSLLTEEAGKYRTSYDKTVLPKNLRKIVDEFYS